MALEDLIEQDIDTIKVKKRIRNSSTLIEPLIESIRQYGLMEPIVIDQNMRLVAGFRRLQACKALGYKKILARKIEIESDEDFLLLEMEENVCRMSFSNEELEKAKKRLESIRHPNYFVWLWRCIKNFFTGKKNSKKLT